MLHDDSPDQKDVSTFTNSSYSVSAVSMELPDFYFSDLVLWFLCAKIHFGLCADGHNVTVFVCTVRSGGGNLHQCCPHNGQGFRQ